MTSLRTFATFGIAAFLGASPVLAQNGTSTAGSSEPPTADSTAKPALLSVFQKTVP